MRMYVGYNRRSGPFWVLVLLLVTAMAIPAIAQLPKNGILFTNGPDGSVDRDLYLIDPLTGDVSLIYDNDELIDNPRWDQSQTRVVFTSTLTTSGLPDIYLLEAATQAVDTVTTGGRYAYPLFFSDDVLWAIYRVTASVDELYAIDIATGDTTRLSEFNKYIDRFDVDQSRSKITFELREPNINSSGEVWVANIDGSGIPDWDNASQLTDNSMMPSI